MVISAGTASIVVIYLAAVELARSRLAALQFQNDVRSRDTKLAVAIHRLRALLGRTDASPIEVTGELPFYRPDTYAQALESGRVPAAGSTNVAVSR